MTALNEEFRLKVKSGAAWRGHDTARLHISVGGRAHEGAAFDATARWADRNFTKTVVCVNDTLQRHNLEQAGLPADEAFAAAEAAGREWIERNQPALRRIQNLEVVRWDQWRQMAGYDEARQDIDRRFSEDAAFRKAVDDEALSFWRRKAPGGEYEAYLVHARRYLLEECAAFSLMFERERAADIYPGSTLLPCALLNPDRGFGRRGFTRIELAA